MKEKNEFTGNNFYTITDQKIIRAIETAKTTASQGCVDINAMSFLAYAKSYCHMQKQITDAFTSIKKLQEKPNNIHSFYKANTATEAEESSDDTLETAVTPKM